MARRKRVREDEDDPDREIIQEAKDRFKKCSDWEQEFVELYVQDTKFNYGDSDNNWQWPDTTRTEREKNRRPTLTINETARHVALISNDARQNKASISIKPTGEEASFESAQIYEGVIRDIDYKSHAQDIYDDAFDSQIIGGIGYWRVNQVYPDNDSFDQELRIEPVRNHLAVKLDCDIKQKSGLDALYGFIFDDIPKKEFEKLYPDIDIELVSQNTGITQGDDWVREDYIRIAEYYRIVENADELYWVEDPTSGEQTTFLASTAPKGWEDQLVDGHYKKRKVIRRQLEWYKIAGSRIIDRRTDLKGQYVPIVRCVGIETQVDGKLVRKGFVRDLKDVQRGLNYNISAEVESAAMATKTKWIGAVEAFEGNEVAWNNMNLNNAPYLTFKYMNADGEPLPPQALPQRIDPAASTPAYLQGMQLFSQKLETISGQFAAQQGKPSNEKSGKAIQERQRQSDIATYLFVNNQAIAIRTTGVIILDLFRHIYDTKRVLQILNKDGTQSKIILDPQAAQAYQDEMVEDVKRVLFNPNVGKYEVQADVGPSYGTQRQEAYNAFVQIVSGAPDLIGKIGDLMFRAADFPMANDIAERLRRDIEANAPYLIKDGAPSPALVQAQQALQQAQGQVADLIQKLAEKNLELKDKGEEHRIWDYEAQSKRLTAETNSIVDMKKMQIELGELMQTILQTLSQMQSSGQGGDNGAPVPDVPPLSDMQVNEPVEDNGNSAIGSTTDAQQEGALQ